jgi:hypothetical protein
MQGKPGMKAIKMIGTVIPSSSVKPATTGSCDGARILAAFGPHLKGKSPQLVGDVLCYLNQRQVCSLPTRLRIVQNSRSQVGC